MKILFVVTNTKRKSLFFVTSELETFSLAEIIAAVKKGLFEKVYTVTGTSGTYIRSAPDKIVGNNIDTLSISSSRLVAMMQGHAKSTVAMRSYIESYIESIQGGAAHIKPVGSFRITSVVVQKVFQSHASTINKVAKEFDIDQFTLGAILIDEIARLAPFEPILEKLSSGVVGRNTTVGVAQVSLETANGLIKDGLYHPNPKDKRLPIKGSLSNAGRRVLYEYIVQPKHNIRFAAALLRSLIDEWQPVLDISMRPDVLGTRYSRSHEVPSMNPEVTARGKQISREFYGYAKKWLK